MKRIDYLRLFYKRYKNAYKHLQNKLSVTYKTMYF